MTNIDFKLTIEKLREVAETLEQYPEMDKVWNKVEDALTELINFKQQSRKAAE
jgi:HPt (histidine-containing phosphotransfer) domain-containing protein